MHKSLREGLKRFFTEKQLDLLANVRIGIAGAGGLGSNVAMLLARSGIEQFTIIDYDSIEPSNLNRQHFWPDQLGMPKVEALASHLLTLNSHIQIKVISDPLSEENIQERLKEASIWVEALDKAELKKIFVEKALVDGYPVFAASGVAGFGGLPMNKKRMGRLTLIGDFSTDSRNAPTLAPRVMQAAALMADSVLEFILK